MDNKIIAVDFDGTLCENAWPQIGSPKQAVIRYVLNQQDQGAKLILWTNRSGEYLQQALDWCAREGILFDAVNENLPEMIDYFQSDCRKVFANEYIDDRAIPMPGERSNLNVLGEMPREVYSIRERSDREDFLTQLAEECAELTQAALKYRRVLTGNSPTPVDEATAMMNMLEEIADVCLSAEMLLTDTDREHIRMIEKSKILRWEKRLKEASDR